VFPPRIICINLPKPMRKLSTIFLFGITFLVVADAYSQDSTATAADSLRIVIADDDPMVAEIDAHFQALLNSTFVCNTDTACLNIYGYQATEIPVFTNEEFRQRLHDLDLQTPMDLRYNADVQAFINLYVNRRRELSSRVLGMSELYYPMIEEMLDKFGIPLEMKHLAIVESALNPTANSRAGAKGLWQFMYATGKMFDLKVTSYEDLRFDPYQSTIAACRYLNSLYGIYGDWNLVLAAYNSGPGNVNKAIRRSGGKKDYWSIRPYLPRETRGYVPAFIAVNYMMNYHQDHNLYPVKPHIVYHETDTLHLNERLSFAQISAYTGVDVEGLEFLNPVYKKHIVPASADEPRVLRLPVNKIGVFIANQDSIKTYTPDPLRDGMPVIEEVTEYHRVRNGEFLGSIANRYGVKVRDLMEWNNLRNTNIYPGQSLVLHRTITKGGEEPAKAAQQTASQPATTQTTKAPEDGKFRYHVVQTGDTLWDIANKYEGVTVNKLKELNGELNFNRLKPGQKIKIEVIG
jgi:membrane-bound lytic murein transglycosylase D